MANHFFDTKSTAEDVEMLVEEAAGGRRDHRRQDHLVQRGQGGDLRHGQGGELRHG